MRHVCDVTRLHAVTVVRYRTAKAPVLSRDVPASSGGQCVGGVRCAEADGQAAKLPMLVAWQVRILFDEELRHLQAKCIPALVWV